MESHYTPLPSANLIEPLKIDVASLADSVPEWAGRERIGINMEVLAQICRSMRMRSLTVLGMKKNGEKERVTISGIFSDGSAVGHAEGSAEFKNDIFGKAYSNLWNDFSYGRSGDFRDFVIKINLAALEHRVANGSDSLRDPAVWADFLNEELVRELRRLAWRRLGPDANKAIIDIAGPVWINISFLFLTPMGILQKKLWKYPSEVVPSLMAWAVTLLLASMTNPIELFATLYGMGFFTLRMMELMITGNLQLKKNLEEKSNLATAPYDPPTILTLGNFEWDRLLMVQRLLSHYKLMSVIHTQLPPANTNPDFSPR